MKKRRVLKKRSMMKIVKRPNTPHKPSHKMPDPQARIKNAAVGYLVGNAIGGRGGGLLGAAAGGLGNIGFFKGGSKH